MSQSAFEHDTRKRIYNHIISYPGVSFSAIKRAFDLADGTLRYHLNYLETRNEIKSAINNRNRCYYPVQNVLIEQEVEAEVEARFKAHKLSATQERLLNSIQRYPGITQKELIKRTGVKRLTLAYNIKKLIAFGVVQKKENGRNTCYHYISDAQLRKEMMKRLIMKFLNHEIDEHTFLALKNKLEY